MQVTQDYQKALQQINNNCIPEDLLADGIKNFVDFTADLNTVFRTRLSIRSMRSTVLHNHHSTMPEPPVLFGQRGLGTGEKRKR